jgi:DNA polymerase-3 subunit delta'
MILPWLDPIKEQLASGLRSERLGHAPLIQGPAGVGKRALADWLVRRILCLESSDRDPCGQCRSCTLLDSSTHPDFFDTGIPEDKREIPVDSIRDLIARLQLTASLSPRRVGRVMPAEAMNRNSANALLKTLEEPAENAWLILVADQAGRLPATIRSRCQVIPVRPPDHDESIRWLESNCPSSPSEQHRQALLLAGAAPLAARALLEGEGLAFGQTIRDGLDALSHGEPLQQVLGEDWVKQAPSTWRWLATWVGLTLRARVAGIDEDGLAGTLAPQLSPQSAAVLWERALAGVQLARGNARQDLLLGKWLLEWQQLSQ